MKIVDLNEDELAKILRRLERLERAAPLGDSSVSDGDLWIQGGVLHIVNDGGLDVIGSIDVTGSIEVAGSIEVTGQLNGDGTITWTGTTNLNGPTNIRGNMAVTGGGKITVGNMTIGAAAHVGGGIAFTNGSSLGAGSSGVEIISGAAQMAVSTGLAVLQISGSRSLVITNLGTSVNGPFTVSGAKSFRMEHPTKPGHWIQHGSTESPVSGTEYWGEATLDGDGECIVELPDYFESLNKPENRTVMVSAIGRPYLVGADRVVDGRFTVFGDADREFSWLVKAERFGGDFEVEPLVEEPGLVELDTEAGDGDADDDLVVGEG